jgi:hypothetical protein
MNRVKGVSTDLPNLPHSLYLLDDSVYRFFASVEPILVVRVYEAFGGTQYLINLVELPLLIITPFRNYEGQTVMNTVNRRLTIVRANQLPP